MMTDASRAHQPVLLAETLNALNIRPNGCYIDATFGRGGHSAAILHMLGTSGRLLALDRDPIASEWAKNKFMDEPRFSLIQVTFSHLTDIVTAHGLTGRLDGLLFDLGVSSPQLDDPKRGFSFNHDGILDMRMNPSEDESAAAWLHRVSEADLAQILAEYGEERFAKRVAQAIVAARRHAPITTTMQLANIISAAMPFREPHKHPATRSFQAIRIKINKELQELQAVLPQAIKALAPGGRLVVISFHSLEDRMVKRFMQQQARGQELPLDLPAQGAPKGMTLRLIGKAVKPTAAEIATNPRARSATLRIAERLA